MSKLWKSITEWFTSLDEAYQYVENKKKHILYGEDPKTLRNPSRGE